MGFFEFDSVLPERRNRLAGSSTQPVNASSVFDFGQEEDLAVYTWGEDTYDGLGDKLLEDNDDFNDDTFGGGDSGPVDRNFDFSGQTARLDDRVKPVYKTTPVAPLRSSSAPKTTALLPQKSSTSKIKGRIPIAGSLEDLWADSPSPTRAPANQSGGTFDGKGDVWGTPTRSDSYSRGVESAGRAAFSSFDEPSVQQQQQQHRHKTLEEIEAEMMGFASSKPRPLTMEEIEREMMSGAGGGGSHPHHGYSQASPFMGHPQPIALQQQQQQQQQHPGFSAIPPHFSPHPHQQLPHGGFPHGQHPQGSPFPTHQQAQSLLPQQHGSPFPGQAHPQSIQQQGQAPFQGVAANNVHTPQGSPFVGHAQPHLLQSQQQAHIQLQQQNQHGFPGEIDPQQAVSNQGPPGLGPGPPREQGAGGAFNLSEMFPALPGQKDAPVAASTDLLGALVGSNEQEQAFVKEELERKIREQERADERRMRKARKIASMAQYNDIMTRSDKDFITRIQVSQLVTQDPYADDFYAQVYGAILRSKLGAPHGPATVVQLTQDGMGVGVGVGGPRNGGGNVGMNRMGRKEGAMQKMAAQVKRIVDAAKQRETTKAGAHLEGVLGKTTVRSAKTAPRPMLQASYSSTDAKVDASKTNGEPIDPNQHQQGQPLNRRETLIAIEQLYDVILKLEQLRRNSPPAHLFSDEEDIDPQDKERALEWQETYRAGVQELWTKLKVDLPVDHSFPHPFISILGPLKGKKLFPRLLRHLNPSQVLTVFTLLLACFSQIDVVWDAPPPLPPYTREQAAREKDTDAFLSSVIPAFLSVLDKCELRMVAGMVGLVVQRCNVVQIAKTRPGVVLLTVLLSRAEVLKHGTAEQSPDPSDIQQWQQAFDGLFVRIASYLPTVFPSANVSSAFVPQLYMAKNHGGIDLLDMPVWQMLSSFALHANMDQQQTLVAELRDKVIEGVVAAKQGWVDEETAVRKVANVDLFLHALGLDSGMITG
ncbi:Uncharacterized conserved protein [Phaffia rhodozyma]|uniref:Uncharacterized conserved protein n=1 Tax=Phaffia rhodozyma TaxID=264483 RepID=A0A0F7SWP8_PHARH|nr:Uncharacterized conserved protein [Phaffia rhodozyma]